MKKRMGASGVFLMFLVMGATASLAQDKQDKDKDKEEPQSASAKEIEAKACPAADVKYSTKTDKSAHPTPEAPAGKALVYVVRPTMMGNKIQTKFAADGQWLGANRGDNYFYFTLDPGHHNFCSQAENRSSLALDVEAGKTYYLQQKITMGFMKARNKLVVIDSEEGKKDVAKTNLSTFAAKDGSKTGDKEE